MKNKDIKKVLARKPAVNRPKPEDYVSTGDTRLDLALTGQVGKGFAKGHYYFVVGDSESGKTFFTLTMLAEASKLPQFDDYKFIVDFPEQGALMDFQKFFGKKVAERARPPRYIDGEPAFSRSLEDFYYTAHKFMSEGPCIWILDSMDSLQPEADIKKFKQDASNYSKGKESTGSYGMAKAKVNSEKMRLLATQDIKKHKSILVIISQTRDETANTMSYQKTKTRSGGHSLKFYATAEIWTSIVKPIYKKIGDRIYPVGQITKAVVRKNRTSGKHQTVFCPFYTDYGFDDIGGNIDFLLEGKRWKKHKGIITAPDLDLKLSRSGLIKTIEEDELDFEVKSAVADLWNEIETKKKPNRRARYE